MSVFTRQSGIGVNKVNEYDLPQNRPARTLKYEGEKSEFKEYPPGKSGYDATEEEKISLVKHNLQARKPLSEQQRPVAPLRRPYKDSDLDFDHVTPDNKIVPVAPPLDPSGRDRKTQATAMDTKTGYPQNIGAMNSKKQNEEDNPPFPIPNRFVADHATLRKVLSDEQCAEVMSWKTNPNYTKQDGKIAGKGLEDIDRKFESQRLSLEEAGYNLKDVDKWENEYRICSIFNDKRATEGVIPDDSILSFIITGLMQFNSEKFQFDIGGVLSPEWPALFEYNVGGHYDWHTDMFHTETTPIPACRKLAMSILVNQVGEDYEGGEIEFLGHLGKVILNKGDCCVFPAYMSHRILPVTKGQRNVIVGWLHGNSFK